MSFCRCARFHRPNAVWGVFARDHPVEVFLASSGGRREALEPMDRVSAGVGVTVHGVDAVAALADCSAMRSIMS